MGRSRSSAEAMLSYWSRMETARRKDSALEPEVEVEAEGSAAAAAAEGGLEEEGDAGEGEGEEPAPLPRPPPIIITPVRWCPTASGSQLYRWPGLAASSADLDSTNPSTSRSWICRWDRSLRIWPSPALRLGSSFRARL